MTLVLDQDIDPHALAGERIAIVGYGSQGRAHALDLRDSGLDVQVGLRPGGASWTAAVDDGFAPAPVAEAVARAGVVALLVPDTAQPDLFVREVAPHLRAGALLLFAHGFNVHYGLVRAPTGVDVGLVAPKGPGALVRRQFREGRGVPCLVAVAQDATGRALARTLAYAHGLGATRAAIQRTSFAEETETDLFGEQAVLCGGMTELVVAGFETLVAAGYAEEVAYFECLHELRLIVDLLHEGGFAKLHRYVSDTAKWGDLSRGARVVDGHVRARMREVLDDIRSGAFAREWVAEDRDGRPRYARLLARDLEHPIERVGARLRARMPWLEPGGGGP
jgi:ketol-acid reductoisomerase